MPDGRDQDFVTRKEFNIERDNNSGKISSMDRRITVLETYRENWNNIPQNIYEISTTMALMQQEISTLTKRIESMGDKFEKFAEEKEKQDKDQSKKLNEIDNKSKIDLMDWVKANWFKLVVGLGILGLIIKDFIVIK